MQVRDPTW